ncbi:hypothetical protein L198_05927 [Cryptococcus wingfieldii CBS 7118]|uniref:Uncharacterized protein n=1 Tax=Cryptococcus wingfieldii CBS 7118 TaxID=1295528 RepID=A0A1E3IS13_9TREE|nr:hypothetical protein L198_05927 [Cryptococcus wingfieldii CBS 7118]ODN91413.1 hypothetical protein L198_05927 [Cryptococcus wingfieldii CBS 7118]
MVQPVPWGDWDIVLPGAVSGIATGMAYYWEYLMKAILGSIGFGELGPIAGTSLSPLAPPSFTVASPPSTKSYIRQIAARGIFATLQSAAMGGYGEAIIGTMIRLSFGSMAVVSGGLVIIPLAVDLLEYYEGVDNVKDLAVLVFHQAEDGWRWIKVHIGEALRKRHLETGKALQGRFVDTRATIDFALKEAIRLRDDVDHATSDLWGGAAEDARRIIELANDLENQDQASLIRLGKAFGDKLREELRREQAEWAMIREGIQGLVEVVKDGWKGVLGWWTNWRTPELVHIWSIDSRSLQNSTESTSSLSTGAEADSFAQSPSTLPADITPAELLLAPHDPTSLNSQPSPLLGHHFSPSTEALHLSLVGVFVVLFFAGGLSAYLRKLRSSKKEKKALRVRKASYGSIDA